MTRLVNSVASPRIKRLREKMAKSSGQVEWSADAQRIFALPRRPRPEDLDDIVAALTAKLKTPKGTQTLFPIQAWLLHEGPLVGGVVGAAAVGAGKSLAGLLMPMVMPDCKRAVLFIPASLKAQLMERDLKFYGEHWTLPNIAGGDTFVAGRPVLHIVSYGELQVAKSTALLRQINPDLIIADEVHCLRNKGASRTGRVMRFMVDNPHVRFVGWSGTLTSGSVEDYYHLLALALDEQSPAPLEASTATEWAKALDPIEKRLGSGILRHLCQPGEDVRDGYGRRLTETLGFVSTGQDDLGVSLTFHERRPPAMPESLQRHLTTLRKHPDAGGWVRPDGEELPDALRVVACARELACGFYYRWRFPNGEPEDLINEWFRIRQDWNREIRSRLMAPREYLDSALLCTKAAIRYYEGGCADCDRPPLAGHKRGCKLAEKHPIWASSVWPSWHDVRKKVYYETETVWESDYLMLDALAWMREAPGIVWVEHKAVGQRLVKLSGREFRYYGGGKIADSEIAQEDGKRSIIASVDAHHFGKNLQMFRRNLIVTMPRSGAIVEQMIGRTHRTGQMADEVEVYLYRHTPELRAAETKARERARYIQGTMNTRQKLCYGTFTY